MRLFFFALFLIAVVISCCDAGAPRKSKKKRASVHDQGLVVGKDIRSNSIIRNYKAVSSPNARSFTKPTLGFVTPWNSHGYDVAKIFNAKFTYISPVWYQIQPNNAKSILKGGHDVDQEWIKKIRSNDRTSEEKPHILPRVLFEGWTEKEYLFLGRNPDAMEYTINLLLQECQNENFDGFVLDFSYINFSGYGGAIRRLIQEIGHRFHEIQKELIIVVPPFIPQYPLFTSEDYKKLRDYVDQFIIMTYDFSATRKTAKGGPSAPTNWMMQSVLNLLPPSMRKEEEHKLLLGLNFFGTTFCEEGSAPILGNQFIELLETFDPTLKWNPEDQEHSFTYSYDELDWTAYYPTLKYIDERLKLAESLGVGISIWELGQGLDYFYDLL